MVRSAILMRACHPVMLITIFLPLGCVDEKLYDDLGHVGGSWVPSAEGPLLYHTPISLVTFSPRGSAFDDESLARAMPTIRKLSRNPGIKAISLNGTGVGDSTLAVLSDLPYVTTIGVADTNVTASGLATYAPLFANLKEIIVDQQISEDLGGSIHTAPAIRVIVNKRGDDATLK